MTPHIPSFVIPNGESESITLHGQSSVQAGSSHDVLVRCLAGFAGSALTATFKQGSPLVWALAG